MKISFVIPAYNEEALIGNCITSIQTALSKHPTDSEIIVVNNNSKDRTKEVALCFEHVRVVDETKQGLTHARHAGFVASTGDLIAYVDADTEMPDGWIATVLEEFSKEPKLAALSGPFVYIGLTPLQKILVLLFYFAGYVAYFFNHYIIRIGSMLQGGNFVVRRSALQKVGGYETGVEFYGEDTDMANRLHKVGHVKWTFRLPIYTSSRRLSEEGIVRTGFRYALNFIWPTFVGKPFTKAHVDVRN